MGDDFGFSNLGVFGSEISTPNLDQLGREGKILTNYYTHPYVLQQEVLLTGVDNHLAGIGTMFENIAPNQVNRQAMRLLLLIGLSLLQSYLNAGYDTFLSGKWHLSGKGYHNGTGPAIEDLIRVLPYLNLEPTILHMDHTILVELLLS